jgi:6-phosphogluconate dehydrogenase
MSDQRQPHDHVTGLIGRSVMGSSFALNVADHGFGVAGYNRMEDKIRSLEEIKSKHHIIETTRDRPRFCTMVRKPRTLKMHERRSRRDVWITIRSDLAGRCVS